MRKAFLVIPAMLATVLTPSISLGAPIEARCFGQEATIVGTNRGDDLTGTAGNDVIVGLRGNDRIDGLEGDDLICGNANWSTGPGERNEWEGLDGGPGDDRLSGGWGADFIYGGEGNDLIRGGQGDDSEYWDDYVYLGGGSLYGGPGADVIRGGPGDDDLQGHDGADFLYGGTGYDQLADSSYRFVGDASLSDHQTIDDDNDSLFGGPDGDRLFTSGGDDYQYGGRGDDGLGFNGPEDYRVEESPLVKDTGDDTYDGGPGIDLVRAAVASTTPVFIDLSAWRASSESLGEDTLLNLENVVGSYHDDTIIGDDGPNRLYGGPNGYDSGRRIPMGNDRLVGRAGDDFLDGLDDTVGSDHFDSVDGGEGNDSCPADADDELISCE
jgi:Ca2+-binding RTX toxin-like protein